MSNLLFVDDTQFFVMLEPRAIGISKLDIHVVVDLKINIERSELIIVGQVAHLEDISLALGCKVGIFPLVTWAFTREPLTNQQGLRSGGGENLERLAL